MAGNWWRKYYPVLLKQQSEYETNLAIQETQNKSIIAIQAEQNLIETKQAENELKQHEFWVDITKAITNPETIDLSFLMKYGVLFLIFFILLWYLIKRRK